MEVIFISFLGGSSQLYSFFTFSKYPTNLLYESIQKSQSWCLIFNGGNTNRKMINNREENQTGQKIDGIYAWKKGLIW